jgi:DNA polymerase-3 subunit gamma/tau
MAEKAVKCHPEFIYRAMNLCNEADLNYRTASNKQFLVELTLAKICQLLSPSPGNSGEGGGQLQKIADSNTPSAPVQQAATTAAAPAAPNVQPKTPVTATPAQTSTSAASPQKPVTSPLPPPAAPPAGKRIIKKTGIGTFSISGNDGNTSQQSSSLTPAATQQRDAAYTPEQLNSAWQSYIKAHPTSHILINTMRASFPSPMEGHTYRVMVENEKQREEMMSAMPSILSTLHDATSNDHIMITVEINQGEASPHTWNERQVLNHMVENNPGLRDFIDDMQLTIG